MIQIYLQYLNTIRSNVITKKDFFCRHKKAKLEVKL